MNHKPASRPDHPVTSSVSDELAWSAFRFIADEMTAAESLAFEARLANEQAAREAVAEAVELFHAVCAAEAVEPAVTIGCHERTRWTQKVAWLASGAIAAAVLVAVAWNLNSLTSLLKQSSSEPTVASLLPDSLSPALAHAWTEVRSEPVVSSGEEAKSGEDSNDEELPTFADEQLTLAVDTPSWMTAAVLGLAGNSNPQPLDAGGSAPQEN